MPAPRRAILANIHESKLDPKVAHVTLDKSGKLVGSVIVQEAKVKSTEKKHEPKKHKKTSKQSMQSLVYRI